MCDDGFDPTAVSDYVFCSPVNEWAIDQLAADAADEAGDAVGGSIGESVMGDLALDAAAGMMQMMEWFADAFVAFPNIDLAGGGISKVYAISMGIAAIVSVFIMFTQIIRTAVTAEGRPLAEAVVGLGKALLAVMTTLTIGSMALVASDELASGIIDYTFEDGDAELRDKLAALFAFGASPELAATLVFLISLAGIALLFVLWGELILRNAALAVLIATSPIAAVGQMSHTTKQWWNKLVSVTIQLIIMKPLIAIIFAVGFSLIGETETEDGTGATDIATLLSGMLVILLAALAWPALARFMTFTSTHVGGGTGLAAVAGAGAGFLSAQSAPAMGGSASSLQFGQAAEARTMAAVGGRMTMAGNKSGAIGGGAMKAAGAAGPWVAGAAMALRAVQRGANSLTQRMEQTAARAGIEGANPYALPGGYPGYHQSIARPPGPDTNGEPRPGHGAPQAVPPPPDYGNTGGPPPPPPIQPPPPNPTDHGGNR
ncbi:proline-rich domain-containing protein [Glycomyces harbinensis]|uniref:TrbL/VirB6 plasmid conjugal transfer protein n=1 Tax=Glycomyces harbinensis TaxID=58114 RepID=A0A1G6Y8K8_9ACTN|nr:proline-rich domain-containing protein [Glycomyces harbinensis]SDD86690.1 hypothetical protein SAMN05216270_108197 [Glycomyces harbinensis]